MTRQPTPTLCLAVSMLVDWVHSTYDEAPREELVAAIRTELPEAFLSEHADPLLDGLDIVRALDAALARARRR